MGHKMPTKIAEDFQPGEQVYKLMSTRFQELNEERAREFIGHELGEFIMYWTGRNDAGAAKANWNSTCLNWMKRQYENKKDALARNRVYGGQQENAFEKILGNLQQPDAKVIAAPRCPGKAFKPIAPKDLGTMSADEGLAALRKFIK